MSGSIMTSHRHSLLSREVFFLCKRREKVNRDTGSLQEGMINFSTLGKFHGRTYAPAFTSSPQSNLLLTFLSFCKWPSLEAHTKPPYTLTLKSNGCIVFIAGLSQSQILVTSKHSIGPIQGVPESHAQAGERWLQHHLGQVGKTTEQLAKVLWERNWTAVAEVSHPIHIHRSRLHNPQLCDDSFEEHVLPYSTEKTGLHLHGLNECSGDFKTQPTAVVDEFAREWGFIVTISHKLSSISEVKAFTEEIGRSGKWNGEALAGFVVRTTVGSPPTKGSANADVSPYSPGSSFFFKVKFDEPYMMYRDWREITKSLLSKGESAKLPKNKMVRPETQTYVAWVKGEIKRNPSLFEGYTKGHGIIATRELFLEWLKTEDGKKAKRKTETEKEATQPPGKVFGKTIIMPIAVPGVGMSHSSSTRCVRSL